MATKTKTFDCIEAKRKTHQRLRVEYESQKFKFSSIVDFLNAKVEKSEMAKIVREKIERVEERV